MFLSTAYWPVIYFLFVIECVGPCAIRLRDLNRLNQFRDVLTDKGVVRGWGAADGDYMAFIGIPYAAPPIGDNRFKAPLPVAPWSGILEANRNVTCPQTGTGNEDCLVINVFTPLNLNGTLPVLVYIHGGSFLYGRGQTRGIEPLIKQNVIVVTFNYRLGALGFLCLGTEEVPGNAGLKDQLAALRWVQRNIKNFGGDPSHVTLYGMSAGAASVELHILANVTGLFQRAIIESASATSVWVVDYDPIATAKHLAKALDFPETNDLRQLVGNYRKAPVDKVTVLNHDYYNNLTDGTFGFVPCLEKGPDAFLTKDPYETLKQQQYTKVPLMVLYTTLEGLFLISSEYYAQNYKEKMNANFQDFLPKDLDLETEELRNDTAKLIKQFYFGNKSINNDTIIDYFNYFGDHMILHGLLNAAEEHAKDYNPVYLLEFGYKGRMGSYEEPFDFIPIAGHGNVVKHALLVKPILNDDDKLAVDKVSSLIANFVKYGNPTPVQTDLLPVTWPAVEQNNKYYLYLNKTFHVSKDPYSERMQFWNKLYEKYRRKH